MQSVRGNISLEELSERISKIFSIEQIKHTSPKNKITGIKFNLDQKNENFNHTIIELLNLYIVPAFVLPNNQKNETTGVISVKIGNSEKKFASTTIKRYVKQDNTYIESTQPEQQNNSYNWLQKKLEGLKQTVQALVHGEVEIEFIEINKDNLNFQISSNESTEVEITFAESEINIKYIKSILDCISGFLKLKNHDSIKPPIEIDYNQSVVESHKKLNIYPFFAKKTIRNNKGNIKQQETTLCLTTTQNDVTLVSSIFKNDAGPLKIKYKENEYSLLSYSLDNLFSQSLVGFLLFFNDPSRNKEAQISNLQRIEKIFSEDIEIKGNQEDKEENTSNKAKIRIENATCFTSSLHYEDENLQLKKSGLGEKIHFNFEVRVENDLDQKESKFIYDSTIYKIASLISFFALSFNENKFSISVEVDTKNIFSIKINSYSELVPAICEELKKYADSLIKPEDYTNPKSQHVQVLDLFFTKKVSFKLEAEAQKIAINRLKDVEGLISGISILDSCKKEFLDNISNPSVHCYLSNFFYKGNNLSCEYVIAYKDLKINNHLLDENSGIVFLKDKLQKSFDRISNNLKQIQKEENFSVYSIDINVNKLLGQHIDKLQEEEAIEATEETEIIEVKAESEKYDVDWQEECFAKITPANDYTSLELGLKEACKFVHYRILHVCKQLLKKICTLQRGKEQKAEQDDQLSIDESIIQATLDDNISTFNKFIDEKVREFKAINLCLNSEQKKIIVNIGKSISDAVQNYQKVAKTYLFINKNANDLQKILKKNVEELEKLISDIQMSKIDQSIAESDEFAEELKQLHFMDQQTKANDVAICSTKGSQSAELGNAEKGSIQENKITSKYILELFKDLSKKLYESENLNQETDSNESQDTFTLFHNLKSQITKYIDINQKQGELYKKIYQKIHYIYYSCLELAELEIREIEGVTRSYLLGEKAKELEIKEAQLEQEINTRKIGSDIIISAAQSVISLYEKTKDKVINLKNQLQSPNVHNTEYPSNSSYSQDYYNTYNYNNQLQNYRQHTLYSLEVTNQPNNPITDSTYNHKRSNLQKLKVGIKDAFSEKENYAFLVFIVVGAAGTLAYFVPEGLRKFVPSKKLNIIDITVAIGATALIALSVAALAYSVHTSIVHSNVTDPTTSFHNVQSLNS